ncbi:hypothetical protein, partial [Bacteroides fragilis]|uniref:hypothetical protein n=1 Tax=Bacteroides fragilis TaxID=817 RepID=UPI0030CACB89
SAPEINLSPTALTMLTRASVQFLFDSCLIPVHSPFTPIQFPFNPYQNPVVFSVYLLLKSLFSPQFPPANTSPSPFLGKSPFPSPR